jgi:hypothetical protein
MSVADIQQEPTWPGMVFPRGRSKGASSPSLATWCRRETPTDGDDDNEDEDDENQPDEPAVVREPDDE